MIQKSYVKRARVTGLPKNQRRVKGSVYLPKTWLGKKVVVLTYDEYLFLKRSLKSAKYQITQIQRVVK